MFLSLKGFNKSIVHEKKSYTTGAHKDRIEKLLKLNTPYVARSLLAADMCEEGDDEPCLLPTTKTLTKQKYRMKLKETESYLDPDPVLALVKMKSELENVKTIHNVAISPFYVMYSTPTQAALVKSQKRRSRITFSMDATGVSLRLSPLASKSDRTEKLKRCFLYVITLHQTEDRSLPIYQMISQDHSSIQISNMLKMCSVENNHITPNEVVVDQSAAILLALVETYTRFKSVHQYLDHCYDILQAKHENLDSEENNFYARFDRSHVCKSIQLSKELKKGVHKDTATFYKRLLGFLIQEPSKEKCENIMKKIFKVLYNRFLTEDVRQTVKELEVLSNQHKIDKMHIESESELPDTCFETEYSDDKDKPKNKFQRWIFGMAQSAKTAANNNSSDDDGYDKNPYFADTLQKALVKFLTQLPLSGNIMNEAKGSNNLIPTSSSTESDFSVLKNDLFRGSHGIRVDSFVNKHLVFTKGRLIGKHTGDVRAELFDDQSQDDSFQNSELQQPTCDDKSDDKEKQVDDQ